MSGFYCTTYDELSRTYVYMRGCENSTICRSLSFFPGFDGTIPESPASAATPAEGAGEVVSGSCGCVDGYIPERNEDSELVKCR